MTAEEMTSIAPGNTKTGAVFRSRSFQFTLNDIVKYNSLKLLLTELKTMDYYIAAEEIAPTTGHKHIHIYVHFSQTYRLSKKILNIGAHIEICKGSPKQNIAYIKKDGNIIDEFGSEPHQGIRTVEELAAEDINSIDPHLYKIKKQIDAENNDIKTFQDMLDEIRADNLKAPEVIYITGDSGKGKTYKAYKLATEKYSNEDIGKLTLKNEFIDVINSKAKCFVIEEFRPSQIKASDFLQLTDKYGYRCNIKGGFQTLRPEMLIICSILPPEDIYREEINKQFIRRITRRIDL